MKSRESFSAAGFDFNEEILQKFESFYEIFSQLNSQINLSAIREESDIYKKHFIDSVLPTKFFDFNKKNILDLGAGGGFPCLPLAILYPDSQFLALDSVGKKMESVQKMANFLNLKNLKTVHGRAEDLAKNSKYRENFDLVISRAVAPWNTLLELTLPFVKVNGIFLAYQGTAIFPDLKKFKNLEKKLGGKFSKKTNVEFLGNERVFIEILKIAKTSKKFPREVGMAKKNPLNI